MIKIGFYDFWGYKDQPVDWLEIDNYFLLAFRTYGLSYKVVDPTTEEADIVFKSSFKGKKELKGKPVVIGVYYDKDVDFTLSFNEDTKTNLYYPLWQLNYDRYLNNLPQKNYKEKDLFCTFLQQITATKKIDTLFYICEKYKTIISCGSILNTAGYTLPDLKTDCKFVQNLHKRVKFNLCLEKNESSGQISHITEKIIDSYTCGTVPIYWGAENITKWFNPDSFINCNGLSDAEIVEKIKEVDNNEELYKSMLYAQPFKKNINWKEYSEERLIKFLRNNKVL